MRPWAAAAWLLLGPWVAGEPRLSVDPQSYDFGRVRPGKLFRQSFTLSNSGADPLALTSLDGDCECLRVEGPRQAVIGPGRSTTFVLVFGSRRYRGRIERTLTVRSNDPQQPALKVPISATVIAGR